MRHESRGEASLLCMKVQEHVSSSFSNVQDSGGVDGADGARCSRYLFLQVFLWYLDGVVLDSVSVPLVGDLLGHQLLQDEEQQLVVVPAEGQVTGKRLDGKNRQHRGYRT